MSIFLGLLQLVCEDYDMAAESLFYAGNLRYAYCAAYQGAQKKKNGNTLSCCRLCCVVSF
ncbi:MAG: hypothetical protein ACLSFT_02500 [Ruminococcus callidus]